jgi:uncharacterized lipoprotein YddW (UPF0748 family)
MRRREFLKRVSVGVLDLFLGQLSFKTSWAKGTPEMKNWAWYRARSEISGDEQRKLMDKMRAAGIQAILPEVYNSHNARFRSQRLPVSAPVLEQLIPMAKSAGLEVHAWMWSMPNNIEKSHVQHPEWFAVNGKGESALQKPAYVDYYKFMCPNRPGVQEFVEENVKELAQYDDLDGIHLDYIRLPDVILAENLQPKYGIVQDREYPEYDYCYCEICRSLFEAEHDLDPLNLKDPSENQAWRQFRCDSITNLVNDRLIPAGRKHDKVMTAAVFPNWQHVRQEWSKWHLDAVLPMLYNSFYNQTIGWIKEKTATGVHSLPDTVSLYSGLFVPALEPEELIDAIEKSLEAGADGVSLFAVGSMTDRHWAVLSKYMNR